MNTYTNTYLLLICIFCLFTLSESKRLDLMRFINIDEYIFNIDYLVYIKVYDKIEKVCAEYDENSMFYKCIYSDNIYKVLEMKVAFPNKFDGDHEILHFSYREGTHKYISYFPLYE